MSRRKQARPQHLSSEQPQSASREFAEAASEAAGEPGEWRRGPRVLGAVFSDFPQTRVGARSRPSGWKGGGVGEASNLSSGAQTLLPLPL